MFTYNKCWQVVTIEEIEEACTTTTRNGICLDHVADLYTPLPLLITIHMYEIPFLEGLQNIKQKYKYRRK
jgi:hypothetical protein